MKLSLLFDAFAPLTALVALVALAGCASHPQNQAPPQTPSLTSATLVRTAPPPENGGAVGTRPRTEVSAAPDESVAIEMWANRYPDASSELLDWMQHYPNAAAELSVWDSASPIQMKALVDWALTHRYEGIGSFLFDRSGLHALHEMNRTEPEATSELLEWIRRSPPAAEELFVHADALAWAGKHLRAPAGHVPMAAKSMVAPSPHNTTPEQITRPATSPWNPTPTPMVR